MMESEDKINILIVDDSPTNLLALETVLQGPDRNLIRAESGDDALRFLLGNEVAVILLDVFMPGIDGLDTAALIRSRDKSRNTPIIFLTADSTGGRLVSRGYSLGAVDYIVKPIEPDVLRSKVAVFVELFKKTREVQRQAELLREKNLEIENANLARLGMLIDLGQELTSEHDPEQVLRNFCRSARRIVEAQEAGIGILGRDGRSLRYFFRCGEDETPTGKGDQTVPWRALNSLISERRPLRLNESDALLHDNADNGSNSDSAHSFLGAPIVTASRVRGWVYLLNKVNADDFTEADERLAATLATQVASAYENARLYSKSQKHADELQLEISERQQAEGERAELLVREQAARAEAELANRTKDEFLAVLSHELRTPLSAILGWSHLVRTSKLDDSQMARAFETIERNARSQSQLIDDLLDVSRIITGKLEIEYRQVNLCSVIEAAVEALRPSFETKDIQFETILHAKDCFIQGDATRLQQIFWNLFSNAMKFTPQKGNVRVELERSGPEFTIAVSDTGVGISTEFIPYIFDRFRQADGSTTRNHGGLGLGLAIVRHLVELHNGSVAVESPGKDQGSTFTVHLPVTATVVVPEGGNSDCELASNGQALNAPKILEGVRVLVVDDESDARDLVSAILTRCGGEVRCSESAAAAMLAFKEWQPDVLISDIGMPDEDGYTLIKKVRKLRSKRAKEIPAVALTAYVNQQDKARALAAGFQAHLPKPIEPEALVKCVAEASGRKT
ncbi:MAG: two-component hybrid sensor and regulator [Acidobacteria bacterium]|nr:two-component hybrid sensor and regulator [Acidobacteriota bacterium]